MPKRQNARDEGFKAGQVFGARCPYPENSREWDQWEHGWSEAVLTRTSADWAKPLGSWHKLVKWFNAR